MSYEYLDNSDRFTLSDIQDIDFNPWIQVKVIPNKGRCIYSKKFIPKGTIVFKDIPHSAIVDNQFKKNICNTCFKLFSESNRHNIITCPSCGEVNYCSEYCKQFSKIETKHFELECRWIHEFSLSYKYQLTEDDRNIILLVLKIIARRLYEKKSLEFENESQQQFQQLYQNISSEASSNETCATSNGSNSGDSIYISKEEELNFSNVENLPMIPNEIQDLIDHLDEYLKNSRIDNSNHNNNNNVNSSNNSNNIKENEFIKYSNIWKNDLKRLINTALIIKNIVCESIDQLDNSGNKKVVSNGFLDSEGDSEMTDNSKEPEGIQELIQSLTEFDFSILRLLCKIRSNYFGLWHTGYKSNLNKCIFDIDNKQDDQESINQYIWIGSAVYLKLSLFNHSCFPNCTTLLEYNINHHDSSYYSGFQSDNQLSISIITLRDIKENQELLITYIPLNQKGSDRYNNLKSNWMFSCDCLRCHYEKISCDTTERVFNDSCCQNSKCSGGLLLPIAPKSNEGICRVCKNSRSPLPTNFDPLI